MAPVILQCAASEERAVQVTYYDGSGRRVVYEGHVQLATNGVREARRRATVRAMARPCGGRRGRGRREAGRVPVSINVHRGGDAGLDPPKCSAPQFSI